jgi:G3E family GTPase
MVGGFLGAGKTTVALKMARWLTSEKGLRVALITNDQASGLVDTALVQKSSFAVREIGGGCFCCKSDSLVEAMNSFSDKVQPDVIIGEPVGSCTDLVATVLEPLTSVYKTEFALSPLSVLVDAFRAERVLRIGTTKSGLFSPEVDYIYRKQLEEAAFIVVNKCELFLADRREALVSRLRLEFPKATIRTISGRTGEGLISWWGELMANCHRTKPAMNVDYAIYAEGESRLGWLNGEYDVRHVQGECSSLADSNGIKPDEFLLTLASYIKAAFDSQGIEVAHLKMALQTANPAGEGGTILPELLKADGELSVVQWVSSKRDPELTLRTSDSVTNGRLVINLRAEAHASALSNIVENALRELARNAEIKSVTYSAFAPLPPTPTHRITL